MVAMNHLAPCQRVTIQAPPTTMLPERNIPAEIAQSTPKRYRENANVSGEEIR